MQRCIKPTIDLCVSEVHFLELSFTGGGRTRLTSRRLRWGGRRSLLAGSRPRRNQAPTASPPHHTPSTRRASYKFETVKVTFSRGARQVRNTWIRGCSHNVGSDRPRLFSRLTAALQAPGFFVSWSQTVRGHLWDTGSPPMMSVFALLRPQRFLSHPRLANPVKMA